MHSCVMAPRWKTLENEKKLDEGSSSWKIRYANFGVMQVKKSIYASIMSDKLFASFLLDEPLKCEEKNTLFFFIIIAYSAFSPSSGWAT